MNVNKWMVGQLEKVAHTPSADAKETGRDTLSSLTNGVAFTGFVAGFALCASWVLAPGGSAYEPMLAIGGGVALGAAAGLLAGSLATVASLATDLETKAEHAAVALRDGARLVLKKMNPLDDSKALSLFSALTVSAVEIAKTPNSAPLAVARLTTPKP